MASKTDNRCEQGFPIRLSSAEAPDSEPYACFVQRKEQIAAWLRAGYSVKGVWNACQRATPPFEGSYQTFWRYCRMHGSAFLEAAPCVPPQRKLSNRTGLKERGHPDLPKIWPRLDGKPREFIPRTED